MTNISNETEPQVFIDTIVLGMDKNSFLELVREELKEEDKEAFGDNYKEQMIEMILYFSVFAPYPATFDSNTVAGVVDSVGSSDLEKTSDPTLDLEHTDTITERTEHIILRAMELGIIKMDEDSRFYIEEETIGKLLPILEQFEEGE